MTDMLSLSDICAGYGETVVLDGISLTLGDGDNLAVLGRNGVGKTTLLATVMGHTTLHAGSVVFAGRDIARSAIYKRALAGIGYVPQEREIFPSLSVEENLTVAAQRRPGRANAWTMARVFDLFPSLAARRRNMGNQLSGGEQQMLSIGRALMGNPSLLLLDEPLEGLAPVIIDALIAALHRLRQEDRLAIMLVEQHARLALEFAPRVLILDRGKAVWAGDSRALLDDPQKLAGLIGVAG
ncbi:MAG: ABC transporter ATP-binding protein [Rhodospirillales bacterium]|nr:ABC transporter ATP-binding protein [Rhodospirillales bacterium]